MLRLLLFAIGINDVRDIFGADADLAARLRSAAERRLAARAPERKRSWFKPMLRRDPDTEVRTTIPLRSDGEALLGGGFIEPDRLGPSWVIFTAWLYELSAAATEVPFDTELFDRVEWDLARAGLNSDYSLRRLADRQLGTSLRPLPRQVAGYAKSLHVAETASALRAALADPELPAETATFVAPILGVLEVAVSHGLDLVVVGAE